MILIRFVKTTVEATLLVASLIGIAVLLFLLMGFPNEKRLEQENHKEA